MRSVTSHKHRVKVGRLNSEDEDNEDAKSQNSLYSAQSMLSRHKLVHTPEKLSARGSHNSSQKQFDNSDDARSYEEFKRKRRMALRKKRAQKIISELKDPSNFFQGKTTLPRKEWLKLQMAKIHPSLHREILNRRLIKASVNNYEVSKGLKSTKGDASKDMIMINELEDEALIKLKTMA